MPYSVYAVVEKCTGRVKIGHSQNPKKTIHELQRGNPDELDLVWTREYPTKADVEDAEGAAHDELGRLWIRGEWYKPEALRLLPGILDDYAKQ